MLTTATNSNTVIFRTLFEDRIATTEPEHIKVHLPFPNRTTCFLVSSRANKDAVDTYYT